MIKWFQHRKCLQTTRSFPPNKWMKETHSCLSNRPDFFAGEIKGCVGRWEHFPNQKSSSLADAIPATHAKDTTLTWTIKLLSLRLAGGDVHEVLSHEQGEAQLGVFPEIFPFSHWGYKKVWPIPGNVQKSQIFWPNFFRTPKKTFLRVRWWMHFL